MPSGLLPALHYLPFLPYPPSPLPSLPYVPALLTHGCGQDGSGVCDGRPAPCRPELLLQQRDGRRDARGGTRGSCQKLPQPRNQAQVNL